MPTASRRRANRLSSTIATLLSGVMIFQLVLAGSGTLCVMPQRDGMPAMQESIPQASQQISPSAHSAQQIARSEAPADQPCDSHGVPPQCVTMAACAPGVLPSIAAVALAAPHLPSRVVVALVITPASHTPAPELPPPRA